MNTDDTMTPDQIKNLLYLFGVAGEQEGDA